MHRVETKSIFAPYTCAMHRSVSRLGLDLDGTGRSTPVFCFVRGDDHVVSCQVFFVFFFWPSSTRKTFSPGSYFFGILLFPSRNATLAVTRCRVPSSKLRLSNHQERSRRVHPGARRGEVQVPHRGAPQVSARRRFRCLTGDRLII